VSCGDSQTVENEKSHKCLSIDIEMYLVEIGKLIIELVVLAWAITICVLIVVLVIRTVQYVTRAPKEEIVNEIESSVSELVPVSEHGISV
jgi:hypothetical protein